MAKATLSDHEGQPVVLRFATGDPSARPGSRTLNTVSGKSTNLKVSVWGVARGNKEAIERLR